MELEREYVGFWVVQLASTFHCKCILCLIVDRTELGVNGPTH